MRDLEEMQDESKTQEPGSRLTPDEFKAVYKQRGWTGATLALRWEVSKAWISKIGKNPERAAHWDDAVRGLPQKNEL